HLVSELGQLVGQVRDDPLRPAIKLGRNSLRQRRHLGDFHDLPDVSLFSRNRLRFRAPCDCPREFTLWNTPSRLWLPAYVGGRGRRPHLEAALPAKARTRAARPYRREFSLQ